MKPKTGYVQVVFVLIEIYLLFEHTVLVLKTYRVFSFPLVTAKLTRLSTYF